jgi:hypothetical protein
VFSVTLPLQDRNASGKGAEHEQRILLIEDNEQNRYLATFLLQARGWDVVHGGGRP